MQINFKLIKDKLNNNLRVLLVQVGTESVNFSKDNFRAQGWRDTILTPWKKRRAGAKRDKGRAILVDTGRLKRSIRIMRLGSNSVTIGSDVPYASIHNNGFNGIVAIPQHTRVLARKTHEEYTTQTGKRRHRTIRVAYGETTVKAHRQRMNIPQRRFVGRSMSLNNRIRLLIRKQVNNAFK